MNQTGRIGQHNARKKRCLIRMLIGMVFTSLLGVHSQAQDRPYPSKPIRIVIPFAPGGTTDTPWRIIAPKLAEELGGEIYLENRPGAGASLGAAAVATSPPDGYTLLATSNSHAATGALYKSLPYDPVADFVAIAQVASTCQVLAVHPSLGVSSVAGLIALAKKQPGKIYYSSAGNGTTPHLFFELLTAMTGTKMVHVPYKSLTFQIPDLVAGRVPVGFIGVTAVSQFIENHKVLALAVSCGKRTQFLRNVPTMKEAGVKGYEADQLTGLLGPKGLSPKIIQRLEAALQKVLARQDVQEAILKTGNEVSFAPAKDFDALMGSELTKWRKVILDAGITPD